MISVVISTHGDGTDLPIALGCLDRQRRYFTGKTPNYLGKKGTFREVKYLAGPYLNPFEKKAIEAIVVCHGPYTGPYNSHYRIGADPRRYLLHGQHNIHVNEYDYKKGSYGHHCREAGIKEAAGDWIVLTSSDNLFFAWWLNTIKQHLQKDVGIVSWNILNNYWGNGAIKVNYSLKTIKRGNIDMMCVCVKWSIAKNVGFKWRNMSADFDYIHACYQECEKLGLRTVHINNLLGAHQ